MTLAKIINISCNFKKIIWEKLLLPKIDWNINSKCKSNWFELKKMSFGKNQPLVNSLYAKREVIIRRVFCSEIYLGMVCWICKYKFQKNLFCPILLVFCWPPKIISVDLCFQLYQLPNTKKNVVCFYKTNQTKLLVWKFNHLILILKCSYLLPFYHMQIM